MERRYFAAEFINCHKLSEGVFRLQLKSEQPLNALPGQFVALQSLRPDKIWGRPFSVFWQKECYFSIVFSVRGENTKEYSQLTSRDKIHVTGPLGKPLAADFDNRFNIYVAGGIGLYGLMLALSKQAKNPNFPARLYFGAQNQKFLDSLFLADLSPNITVKSITDEQGMVTDLLHEGLTEFSAFPPDINIIACGPEAMLRKTAQIAKEANIPCQVLMETLMACGVGSCKGCAIPRVGGGYFHLCEDGPALPANQIDWKALERPSVIMPHNLRTCVEKINMGVVLQGQNGKSLSLPSPVIADSGCLDEKAVLNGPDEAKYLGAVKSKGITFQPRAGNRSPRIKEIPGGMLNSIGLENVGLDEFINIQLPMLESLGLTVIPNISGNSVEEYAEMAVKLERAGVKVIELNLSCPNTKRGGQVFAVSAEDTFNVVSAVHKAVPYVFLLAKLSPMAAANIIVITQAAESAGADAVSLVNTFLGMKIDLKTRMSAIGNMYGGMSGPAMMPMALRLVHMVAKEVKIPVIGGTGISSASDAAEFIIAGAQAVSIGTALFSNPNAATDIYVGLKEILSGYGMSDIKELVGSLIV